jgi:hypothetical protein
MAITGSGDSRGKFFLSRNQQEAADEEAKDMERR